MDNDSTTVELSEEIAISAFLVNRSGSKLIFLLANDYISAGSDTLWELYGNGSTKDRERADAYYRKAYAAAQNRGQSA